MLALLGSKIALSNWDVYYIKWILFDFILTALYVIDHLVKLTFTFNQRKAEKFIWTGTCNILDTYWSTCIRCLNQTANKKT